MKDNFIDEYHKLTEKHEAPKIFHEWCALSCISAAIGRSCWIERPWYRIYPSLYVILVAPTGKCRKGGAMRIAMKFISQIPELEIIRERTSANSLLGCLYSQSRSRKDGCSQAFVYAEEADNLLSRAAHKSGIYPILIALADHLDIIEDRHHLSGVTQLQDIYLNILAGTTLQWIFKGIPAEAATIGLAGRTVFICQMVGRRFPDQHEDKELEQNMAGLLLEIHDLRGGFVLDEKSAKWYDTFYRTPQVVVAPSEPTMGYYERKHDLFLKLAILYCAAESNSRVITPKAMFRAQETINEMEKFMGLAYFSIGSPVFSWVVGRVIRDVTERGWVSYKRLASLTRNKSEATMAMLDMTLNILVQAEYLIPEKDQMGLMGYRTKEG